MCGCCVRIRAGISVRVRDGVRISNRVRRRVKLVNYSLITALPIATSADPHIRFLPVADNYIAATWCTFSHARVRLTHSNTVF